jgi:hypothetical protein
MKGLERENFSSISPLKPSATKEKLTESVMEKLGQRMKRGI